MVSLVAVRGGWCGRQRVNEEESDLGEGGGGGVGGKGGDGGGDDRGGGSKEEREEGWKRKGKWKEKEVRKGGRME